MLLQNAVYAMAFCPSIHLAQSCIASKWIVSSSNFLGT